MRGKQHIIAGAAAAAAFYIAKDTGAGFAVGSIVWSLLPDIDTPESTIGHVVPVIPGLINGRFGHRNVTHNIFFAAFFAGLYFLLHDEVWAGFFVGILTHLILDTETYGGIQWFYPFVKKRLRLTKVKSGSFWCWPMSIISSILIFFLIGGISTSGILFVPVGQFFQIAA